jgi:uncharacterized membrane protein
MKIENPNQAKPASPQYIIAVVAMFLIAVIGSVTIEVLRPDKDNSILIALILGFVSTTTPAIMAFMQAREAKEQTKETHMLINSRLTEWMESARKESFSAGVEQGRTDANQRTDDLKNAEDKSAVG